MDSDSKGLLDKQASGTTGGTGPLLAIREVLIETTTDTTNQQVQPVCVNMESPWWTR
jgi:hypothetical protein